MTENTVNHGAAEPESITVAVKEASPVEVLGITLDISEDVRLTECAASEDKEKLEQTEGQTEGHMEGQMEGQTEGQTEGHMEGQTEGQTVSPPGPESSTTESKWVVGASCGAVWSEDGRLYLATVVSVDGERCRVRFQDYGDEEEVELSALRSPDADLQTVGNSGEWKPGSRCRAVYSEDGLTYPAVVLWVKGQRCRVRFDDYNNEQEQDVSGLLKANELHGLSRAAAAKGSDWKSSGTDSNSDWRRSREEKQGERRRERSAWRDDQHNSSLLKDKPSNETKVDKDSEEKKEDAEKPANPSFPFFPPFPPPQLSSGDHVPYIPPPPPPLWTSGEKNSDSINATSNMLMLWYMCGFHTGSYMAQQEIKSSSKH